MRGYEQGKNYAEEASKMGFKNETFILDVEDIFFVVEESLLSEAVKDVLHARSDILGEDKVSELLDKLQRGNLRSIASSA